MSTFRVVFYKRGALRPVLSSLVVARTRGAAKAQARAMRDSINADWFEVEE
jgi:hypothetical protein